mmetsp:Transcript_31299/g.89821  ORF Transcript_31299/g.89821 Transcript_31299/m.89821 type:complete len:1481 (+) Transcript_31299:50-4492(+)
MARSLGASVSLPALSPTRGHAQTGLDLSEFRHTYVGANCIRKVKMTEHINLIETAHAKGNLPLLRAALSRAGGTDLGRRMTVQDASKDLSEAKKWMIICENAVRKFDAESMGKLFRAVHELDKTRLGSMIWMDPMYPKLKRVRPLRPYFETLRHLHREHAKGSRQFSAAWVAVVEAGKLSSELTEQTAKWFKPLENAFEEFSALLSEDEVRLLYSDVTMEEEKLASSVFDRLEKFGMDTSLLHVRIATGSETEEEEEEGAPGRVAVVVTGPEGLLGRIRRLNAGNGEPELQGRHAALETTAQKEARTARLLALSGLSEDSEEGVASDPPDEVLRTPRRSSVRRADTLADPRPPRKTTLSWSLAQRDRQAERVDFRRRQEEEQAKRTPVAEDLPSLKRLLIRKFGNLHIAWKSCLDADGNGRISFAEFCKAMHEVGFRGVFKKTWAEMDTDGSGFITLDELDAHVHETLEAFSQLVREKYGSFAAAWKHFDTDGNGMLTESEFTTRCQALDYKGNSRKLFKHLLAAPGAKYIKLSDFAPEAYQQSGLQVDPYDHLSNKERVARERKEARVHFIETTDLPSLKRMLVNKYGSLSSAWRHGLDLDGNQMITFVEFCKAVRQIGFTGNIKALWVELNADDNNTISLEELDPKAHDVLSQFERHVREVHGGHLEAWRALGLPPTSRLDKAKFVKLCQDLGFPGNAHEVYKHLPLEPGKSSLTLADLDVRALQEAHLDPERSSPSSQRQKVSERKRQENALDFGPADWAALRKVMLRRYGTMTAAWKHCLDRDGNGRVTFLELSHAARELGYEGSVKDLWVELDRDGKGGIALEDLDARAHSALTRFRELVLARYTGGFLEAWSFFDSKKNQRVDEPTFTQKCKDLGYDGDPHQLFKYLLDDPSKDNITLADIDPKAAHESYLDPDRFDLHLRKKEKYEREQEWHKQRGKYIDSVPSLMKLLVKKYGSLIGAWKHCLDVHGNNKISLMEFCRAMQQLGVGSGFKDLWTAIGQDKSGFITLGELDPKADRMLSEFRELLVSKYGNYLAAWNALDAAGKRRLTQSDFVQQCGLLGYSGDPHQLFRYLVDKPGCDFITLDDIDAQAAYESRIDLEFSDKGERGQRRGAGDLVSLQQLLVRKYGTLPAAWKHCLDPNHNGWIGFVEFCKAMRQVGFVGGLRGLWDSLEKDSNGRVTLNAFDPEAHAALTDFRQLVMERHGGFLSAWKVFDRNGNTSVDEGEFELACTDLGYTGDTQRLFQWLLDEPCFDRLTLADLDPQAGHEALLDPDRHKDGSHKKLLLEREAAEERSRRKIVADLSSWQAVLVNQFGTLTSAWKHSLDINGDGHIAFSELCQALREVGFRGNVREIWAQLDKDKNGNITLEEFDPQAHEALSQFAQLVRGRFQSFSEAWGALFDPCSNGRIDEASFAKSCAELDYPGNAGKLYRYLLDKPLLNSHWLTLEDLEPHHLKKRGRAAEQELRRELDSEGV